MKYLYIWIDTDELIGHRDGRRAKALKQVGLVDREMVYTEITL